MICIRNQSGTFCFSFASIIFARMKNSRSQLRQIFKPSQVVQHYPHIPAPQSPYSSVYRQNHYPYFYQEEIFEELQRTAIVEDYLPGLEYPRDDRSMDVEEEDDRIREEEPYQELFPNDKARFSFHAMKMLDSDSSGRQLPSRNSSVSSITSQQQKSSIEPIVLKLKACSMQAQQGHSKLKVKIEPDDMRKAVRGRRQVGSSAEKRERLNKIKKVQEIGCNCKKSKCLKMYCECFNLQILCGPNCNCVGCGNATENQSHQKAVLDALTRNPKAFVQDTPVVSTGFQLGVELSEVRKGCKCRKTQCKKKYCQCFNSGMSCGIFCQCQDCGNHNEVMKS